MSVPPPDLDLWMASLCAKRLPPALCSDASWSQALMGQTQLKTGQPRRADNTRDGHEDARLCLADSPAPSRMSE